MFNKPRSIRSSIAAFTQEFKARKAEQEKVAKQKQAKIDQELKRSNDVVVKLANEKNVASQEVHDAEKAIEAFDKMFSDIQFK